MVVLVLLKAREVKNRALLEAQQAQNQRGKMAQQPQRVQHAQNQRVQTAQQPRRGPRP